jgi:hypothetical protein
MRKLALPLIACATFGLAAAPSMAVSTNVKQNKKIAKINGAVKGIKKAVKLLEDADKTQNSGAVDLATKLASVETTLNAVVATAGSALPKIEDALKQLKAGLETAGAGLTSLKTLATSTEYGFGQVLVISAGPTVNAQLGSFVETPDIPDSVQQAQTTQQFLAQHTGNLAVAYGIRSAESDGTGADNPAGYCKVTVTNEAGQTQTTAANGDLGGLPFQPVNTKSALTSTDEANETFPFGLKQSGDDADVTTTYMSSVAVSAGDTYTVGLSCVDTSASASDPSA